MDTENYYNKYWKNGVEGGILNLPPSWTKENLNWHFCFFDKYIGKEVLDIGAGDGTLLNYLKNKKTTIETAAASDISNEAVNRGRNMYPDIIFKQGGVDNMPFEDSRFDTVFAIEVIEHILDIENCFEEINRVLKKGGYLCITTTDFNWLKKIILASFFWDKFFYPNNPHIRFFTKNTLIDLCKKNGFELTDYKWNKSYFGLMPKGQMTVFRKVK